MRANDIMTSDPALIAGEAKVPAAAQLMRLRDVGFLPVVDDLVHRRLIGVLTDRDIVLRHVAPAHGVLASVHEHMTRAPLQTVKADASVTEVAELMSRHQIRRLPVVDADGVVIGVIAQADLVRRLRPRDGQFLDRVIEAITRPGSLVH